MNGLTETITVVRPGPRDRHGDPGEPSEHTIAGVVVAPSGSSENVADGDQVTTRWDLYVPNGADITATDRVRRESELATGDLRQRAPWIVVGQPSPWRSPFSNWAPGMVVKIEQHMG